MDSASRFSKGFENDDDEDEEFGRREGSSYKEFNVTVDGKTSDQKVNTPRSKHSATEQRRRSKINERFQILRGLLPNSDQKRDKASFLLEVIEYIQFLQEKLQKYESMYPRWSDENTNLMPWNTHHVSGDGMADPHALRNDAATGFLASDGIPAAPSILSSSQNPTEVDLVVGASYKRMDNPSSFVNKVGATPAPLQSNLYSSIGRPSFVGQDTQRLIPEADNMATQSEWLRSSFSADTSISNDVINEQEELTIDEGTISISTAYSQGVLNTLSQALQSSGIDLSQAGISVHINLRRTSGSRLNASTSMATPKLRDVSEVEIGFPSNLRGTFFILMPKDQDEPEQEAKRHKGDQS